MLAVRYEPTRSAVLAIGRVRIALDGLKVYYRIAADLVLAVHTSFVLFVILGLVLVLVGGFRGWPWVKNLWFRVGHLLAIGVVVTQTWLGAICPLTILENTLRSRAGDAVYAGSFIGHWMETLLYYQAPHWVFVISYTAFGLLVVASWAIVTPRRDPTGHLRRRRTKRLGRSITS